MADIDIDQEISDSPLTRRSLKHAQLNQQESSSFSLDAAKTKVAALFNVFLESFTNLAEKAKTLLKRETDSGLSPEPAATSVRRSTYVEPGEAEAAEVTYIHDRPFARLGKHALLTAAAAVVLLSILGFTMGLTGMRTPHVSGDAVWNQWQRLMGQETGAEGWNELERN